ncbi:triose-phosphate isomerase [Candidatus Mycoplasma pogonae]
MLKTLIIGNWKMNKNVSETEKFLQDFRVAYEANKTKIANDIEFAIAAPFTLLPTFKNVANLELAAQNMSQHDAGAYTGEVSAMMLHDYGVKFVILGHSERREYFHETNEVVNQKMHQALNNNLVPVVCVGETLEEYESGKTEEVVAKQINESLKGLNDYSKVVVAYEPVWAIGTGKTATPEIAQKVCKFIRDITAPELLIQYGGSVSPTNVGELLSQKDINGALVGGASLDADSFVKLLTKGE